MKILKDIEVKLNETPDKQISLTDPDCRSMKTRGEGIVGYNVQTAVDTKHHLIVAHEVTNVGVDRDQLTNMAEQAQAGTGTEQLCSVTTCWSAMTLSWLAVIRPGSPIQWIDCND